VTADVSQAASWLSPDRLVPDIRTALPGPRAQAVLERDAAVTSPSLPRVYPLVPNRASGSIVEDADGNLFLDFNAGIAVNSTGHCHPRVVEAVRSQAEQLLHYSASDFYLPIYSQMCEALTAVLPISGHKRVFLTNSGAEAVEGAMKLTRYATGRPYIISFFGAFHGRTYGAVSLTASKAKYHKGFAPLLPGILHAPYAFSQRDPETGKRTHDEEATFDYLENTVFRYHVPPTEVAAIFLEPVLGRAATSCRRRRGSSGCARCATSTRSCSSLMRCSPGWGAPERCGRSSSPTSSRTS
jgi:4-aminobutyrate aminotransferase